MCAAPPTISTCRRRTMTRRSTRRSSISAEPGCSASSTGSEASTCSPRRSGAARTTTLDLLAANAATAHLVLPLLPSCRNYFIALDRGGAGHFRTPGAGGVRRVLPRPRHDGVRFHARRRRRLFRASRRDTAGIPPAYAIDVVDTTGCGDAFDAGFIAALHHEMDLETALRFAQASAALVATGLGSDAGIRSFEHTLETMRSLPVRQ